jgi:serine/threonine protein phosphatase 1
MRKLFAVGDIHGHFLELMQLMHTLKVEAGLAPETDTVVFLGDYVDGGPDTKSVVEHLMAWQRQYPHWRFLKGNHEDLMLDALVYNFRKYGDYYIWWNQGGQATAHSYLPEAATDYERAIMQPREYIPPDHLDWLHQLPLTYEQDGYLFVHAGFAPRVGLDGQTETDMLWIREAFVNSDWDFDGRRVVFGHTPFAEPLVLPNKIGIDTMFRNYGKVTAVELDTADSHGEPRFHFSSAVGAWMDHGRDRR